MNDQRTSYGVKAFFGTIDLYLDSNRLSCEKNWTPTPSSSGSYGRQAGEIQLDFKILKILYRVNYMDFTLFIAVQCY